MFCVQEQLLVILVAYEYICTKENACIRSLSMLESMAWESMTCLLHHHHHGCAAGLESIKEINHVLKTVQEKLTLRSMAETSSASAITTSHTAMSSSPMQVVHQIRTTLDQDNYLLWKSQILPVLRGHGLESFIDGSRVSPARFSVNSDGIQTSAELWHNLAQIYVSQSMAKTLDLKLQLQTLKKGSSTCSQFLQQLQSIADRLRSIGSVITDQELVTFSLQEADPIEVVATQIVVEVLREEEEEVVRPIQSLTTLYTTSTTPSPQPQALLAEPSTSSATATNWYIDSGATTHVTPDINNLSSSLPYNGPDAVHIGNGTYDYTKFSWIYTCAAKSDVSLLFANFKVKVENLLSTKIKILQCDGGSEYKPLMTQYPEITFNVSCPYTPEQNGVAERKHRHIVELSLASMFHASIPMKYWDVIFESTVYVINRLPSYHNTAVSPFEMLFQQKPNYEFLHVLGCSCYPWLRPYTNHKLEARSEECVFLGYSTLHKGYYCLHLPTDRIYVSRHVQFDEQTFPFKCCPQSPNLTTDTTGTTTTLTILPVQNPSTTNTHHPSPPVNANSETTLSVPQTPAHVAQQSSIPPANVLPRHCMVTRSQTKTLKPKTFPNHQAHTTTMHEHCQTVTEPTCYTQAVKSTDWRSAMVAELSALAQNNTWDLVIPPPDAHIVGSKWIFKLKYKPDGTIERHKARLVAKGYTQAEGIDYDETFSPVVKPTTIRTVLTIALSHNWPCHQLDVNNAFLHDILDETVYMAQPPGFADSTFPNHVCKLKKAIYGLKQTPRAWFSKLKTFLQSHHFNCSQADNSLFIFHKGQTLIYLLVYVDDIIVTGSDSQAIQQLMQSLNSQFSLKNLGRLNHFLGIEVTYSSSGMHLTQTRYLSNILKKASMQHAKPCNTPMQAGKQVSKYSGTKLTDPQVYRSIVGALQYATITRPDLTFAVNKASQFMAEPTEEHWQLVKRILRYIQGTIQHGLVLKSAQSLSLHGYYDADWAGDPDDRRSTTGFAIFLGPNLISWSSKKQATVSKSSTEAEYRSLAVTASEILWLTYLLSELKHKTQSQPTMWCDNLGATFLAANPVFHARTKHIELDFHFVREKIQNK
ncbi:hypothetical protein LUZ61_018007 [Rhynchospora tenuis]|uniref:Integrase catalytic domain-containing protein n=1 Tax=Rhynchospora tenuis TaxID=198213 RepID=A0AAD5Z8J1_9POAL|nr:hypothetical protein LUZ61_018007 [Rhynchospora tenuis]